jgi:hypothetical protein
VQRARRLADTPSHRSRGRVVHATDPDPRPARSPATGRQLMADRMSRSWFRSRATVFSAILTALTILTIVPMQVAAPTPDACD